MIEKWTMIQIILCLLILVGTCICWIARVKHIEKIDSNIRTPLLIVLGLLGTCILFTKGYEANKTIDDLKSRICAQTDAMRYGSDEKGEEEKLVVTRVVPEEIYLRGEIDAAYEDGEWREDSGDLNPKYGGMLSYLKEHEFYPQTQLSSYLQNESSKMNRITILNTGVSRKYIYAPNTIDKVSLGSAQFKTNSENRVMPKSFFGEKEYSYDVLIAEEKAQISGLENANTFENSDMEMVYRNYVYDTYMDIPAEIIHELHHEDLTAVGGDNIEEVMESVHIYLDEMPESTSDVYATKAALLLRYCGVPTRYVNGYYISDTEKKKTVVLTEDNKHTWVEAYVDGIGFVTFEANPDYYNESDAITNVSDSEVAAAPIRHNENAEKAKQKTTNHRVIVWVIGILLTIGCMNVILLCHRRKVEKRKLYSKNMTEFLSFLCNRLENVLKCDNVLLDMNRPYDYQAVILLRYGIHMYYAYRRFVFYMDEILFHQIELSEEELTDMRVTVRRFEKVVSDQAKPYQRFLIRYVR